MKAVCYMMGLLGATVSSGAGMANDNIVVSSGLSDAFETVQGGLDLLIPGMLRRHAFQLRLGAGFGITPDYRGSDDYRLKVLPLIDLRYKDRLHLSYNRLSYSVVREGYWSVGPFVKYKAGRTEKRNAALAGLGDIAPTAEVGVFAKYKSKRALMDVEFRQALGHGRGASVRFMAGHALFKKGDFAVAAIIEGKWRSKAEMQTYFGVTEEQAARSESGLLAFMPSAGVSEVSINILGRYQVSDRHRLLALIGYGHMLGDAAYSPVVSGGMGRRQQVIAGVGFTIDF
ncbi:MAG: MipA/OmpV family protein [Alphaproteobacteria bacterium]|nr:MipA/OmpV family protein [Alphaproteobacteria bacterium]